MSPSPEPPESIVGRSAAAIALLEQLQKRAGHVSGEVRKPEDDDRVLREIAEKKLMAEQLNSGPPVSIRAMQTDLISLVGKPDYAARVEAKVQEMKRYYAQTDGDLWSRYERPDRRRRLSELSARVEKAAAKAGLAIPRRPVIGTLPTYEMNARAIPGPPGEGHLVVFDSGMFNFSTLLGKAAAQAIDARRSGDGGSLTFNPKRLYQQPGYEAALLRQWGDLLFSQAVLGTCSLAEAVPVAPEHVPFSEQIKEAVDTFTLAHEYGHVILKHTDLPGTGSVIEPAAAHAREFAADAVGLQICQAWGGTLWGCLGATVFFYGCEGVTLAANAFLTGDPRGKPSPTHPTPGARRLAVMQRMETADRNATRVSGDIYEAFGKMTGYALPGFVEAHRQGFPEAGYRPASEYEKTAAFGAFWNGCVALQREAQK